MFEPQTWASLAGAAYLVSAPGHAAPGLLHAQQFVPGRGMVAWSIDPADPVIAKTGLTRKLEGDAALTRAGLNRKLRPSPASSSKQHRLVDYEFGRHALPLHRSGRAEPGLMFAGGVEKRVISPRGCGGFEQRCQGPGSTRRISAGFGYGYEMGLVSLTYYNDRILRFGASPFYIDGVELTVLRTYDHLF